MMTRKDYIEVAKAIKQRADETERNDRIGEHVMCNIIAGDLADIFARDNGRFDRYRFMMACGVREDM